MRANGTAMPPQPGASAARAVRLPAGLKPLRRPDVAVAVRRLDARAARRFVVAAHDGAEPEAVLAGLPVAERRRIAEWREEMRAGRWLATGEPIVLNWQGRGALELLDGRKRLLALCGAEGAEITAVVVGLEQARGEEEAMLVEAGIDAHRRRRHLDYISMVSNTRNPRLLAAALGQMATWRDGDWRPRWRLADALEAFRRHRGVAAFIEEFRQASNPELRTMVAFQAAWRALADLVDPPAGREFFAGLHDFERLAKGDPRRLLAFRLAAIGGTGHGGRARDLHAAFALAWNAWRRGETLRRLDLPEGAPVPRLAGWAGFAACPVREVEDWRLAVIEDFLSGARGGHGDLRAAVVRIDRRAAEELLRLNVWNRRPSPATIDRFRRDMEGERWRFPGGALVISRGGRLLDGQHRLMAIARGAPAQEFVLVTGVEETAFAVIDGAPARGLRHLLEGMEVPAAKSVAGATVLVWRLERGELMGSAVPSTAELLECFRRHEEGLRTHASRCRGGLGLTPAVEIALRHLLAREDPALAETFFAKLAGVGEFREGDPVLRLRRRLEAANRRGLAGRPPPRERMVWAARAWLALRRGDPRTESGGAAAWLRELALGRRDRQPLAAAGAAGRRTAPVPVRERREAAP